MKKKLALLSFLFIAFLTAGCSGDRAYVDDDGVYLADIEDITQAREYAWMEYVDSALGDPERVAEMEERAITYDDVTMRFSYSIIGEPDENGYPLYIAMHGGGASDMNDEQYEHMKIYYKDSVDRGIYLAVRGVRDTWDTHFNPESYPIYDRLIQNMILFENADPDRVYLMGFSAGGDGVYAISPRMADRFAAVTMSAGHPNGVSLKNLYNLPILLQCGEFDYAYDRNLETARYCGLLDGLKENFDSGYEHIANIIEGSGHNFEDNDPDRNLYAVIANNLNWLENGDSATTDVNINSIDFLNLHKRDPLPKRVVWDLSTRAELREVESFYWLSAPMEVDEGLIIAEYDRNANRVKISHDGLNGGFKVLLNESTLDLFSEIEVTVNGESNFYELEPDYGLLLDTTFASGDPKLQFMASMDIGGVN